MKITKWLTPLSIATLATASGSFGLVSCGDNGNKPEPTPPTPTEEAIEFINDRTFSLMAAPLFKKNSSSTEYYYINPAYGTGWIIDDCTPNIDDDYWYYLATNWHVTRAFDLLKDQKETGYTYITTDYFFADQSSSTNEDNIIDFYNYVDFNAQPLQDNYIQHDDVSKYIFSDSPSQVGGIDFHVCEVNFVNASETIKNKLNKLNSYRKEKGYINQFANSDDESIVNQTKYIGGYPYKENASVSGGKWEAHPIDASALQYNQPDDESESHFIDSDHYKTFPYYDCSAQYITDLDFGTDWMTGGASGSMLLTEDLRICGIYWGGRVDDKDAPTWFKPRFSLLKTANYDFISQWTK